MTTKYFIEKGNTYCKTFKILEQYEKGLMNEEISEITGFSSKCVTSLLNRVGLKSNKYPIIDYDEKLEQFLIGSFLGDGCYSKLTGRAKNSRLAFTHSIKQLDFLQHKKEILLEYNLLPVGAENKNLKRSEYFHKIRDKKYSVITLKSITHPIFTKIRDEGYPNNTKNAYPEFTSKINSLGLANWYMDDGNVTFNGFHLNTQGFTREDTSILIDILHSNFNLKCTTNKVNVIYISTKSKHDFLDLIVPHIIPYFQYKLHTYYDRLSINSVNSGNILLGQS